MPIKLPVISIAVKKIRMTNPIVIPIMNWLTRLANPAKEKGSSSECGGNRGAIKIVIASPIPTRAIMGKLLILKRGELLNKPRIRDRGHIKATTHPVNWSVVTCNIS